MAQIIHDVAPGAAIKFATAGDSEAEFAANIQLLADAGADIIVDDIGFPTEPFFQDGLVAQAAANVVDAGVAYFSAAGNDADVSYQSAFSDSGQTILSGKKLHDFDPGPGISTVQQLHIEFGSRATLSFQWDQPFASLGGTGSASDLDIEILGADGTTVLTPTSGITNNLNGDPLETIRITNIGLDLDNDGLPDTTFFVRIELVSGPAPGLLKYLFLNGGTSFSIETFATNSGTDFGHPQAPGVVGVAAAPFFSTPALGVSPPILEDFSSLGGTPILFSATGTRLPTAETRNSPQVTGPDGANTTFFSQDIPQDGDSFPNFFGTSAAAPHVAAVAALMLQAAGGPESLTPDTITSLLESTAIDIISRQDSRGGGPVMSIPNGTGFDFFSGAGLVDALAAVQVAATHVSISDVSIVEGNAGFSNLVFTVTLSESISAPVTVNFATVANTAVALDDYVAQSGSLSFLPEGPQTLTITIQVVGDTTIESDESFFVELTDVTNALLTDAQGVGTIYNDDIGLSISSPVVREGDVGTSNAVFSVSVIGISHFPILMSYATSDGTATAGNDYLTRSGTLFSNAGPFNITVPIVGDTFNESTEVFFITFTDPSNTVIPGGVGVCTILDNDLPPSLYISDVQVTMTPAGAAAVFSLALDFAAGDGVSVQYATADGSAIANIDYVPVAGTVNFPQGSLTQLLTVPIFGSTVNAPNEKFYLNIFNPVHVVIADSQGVATIVVGPAPPAETIVDDQEAGFTQSLVGWSTATNLLAYHSDYTMHAPGNGSGTATWTFNNVAPGQYQVFARWVAFNTFASNAPYTVFDGSANLGTVLVNQQVAPAGDTSNGVVWQSLGTFNSVNRTLKVQLSDNANGMLIADAVRIVAGGVAAPTPEMDVSGFDASIIDGATTPGFSDGTNFGSMPATTTSTTHNFTITNTGSAELHLSGNPRVSVSGAAAQDFTVVTQPAAAIAPGRTSTFQILFHPTAVGLRKATISIANDDPSEPNYSFAVAGTGVDPAPDQLLIDNSTAGYSQRGNWTSLASALAVQGEFRTAPAGQGNDFATWTFTGLAPGRYLVYTTWAAAGDSATNSPYTVSDGGALEQTFLVNQQLAPGDGAAMGMAWKSLTAIQISTGTLMVRLNNQANGSVRADAVLITRSDLPAPPVAVPPVSTSAHNASMPLDVNDDRFISALDALVVINKLIAQDTQSLSVASAVPLSTATATQYFLDVNDDTIVSPIDALIVINYLNQPQATTSSSVTSLATSESLTSEASSPSELSAVATDQAIGQFSDSGGPDNSVVWVPQGQEAALLIGEPLVAAQPTRQVVGAAEGSEKTNARVATIATPTSSSSMLLTPANVRAAFFALGSKKRSSDDDAES